VDKRQGLKSGGGGEGVGTGWGCGAVGCRDDDQWRMACHAERTATRRVMAAALKEELVRDGSLSVCQLDGRCCPLATCPPAKQARCQSVEARHRELGRSGRRGEHTSDEASKGCAVVWCSAAPGQI
jgi:hypothetical protein